jgi:hypothetical protein
VQATGKKSIKQSVLMLFWASYAWDWDVGVEVPAIQDTCKSLIFISKNHSLTNGCCSARVPEIR